MKLIQKIKNKKRQKEIKKYYKKPSFIKVLLIRGIIIFVILSCAFLAGLRYLYGSFRTNNEHMSSTLIDLYKRQFEKAYDRYILKSEPEFLSKIEKKRGAELSDDELYDQYVNCIRRWGNFKPLYGESAINLYDINLENGVMDFDKPYLSFMDKNIYDDDPANETKTCMYYSYRSDELADELLRIMPAKKYDNLVIHIDGYFIKGFEFIPKELYFGASKREIEHNKILQELLGDGEEYFDSYIGQTEKRYKFDTGVGSIDEMESQGYTYVDNEIYGSFGSVITGICPIYPCSQEQKNELDKAKEFLVKDNNLSSSLPEKIETDIESVSESYDYSIDKLGYEYTYGAGIKNAGYYFLYHYDESFWDDVFWYYEYGIDDTLEQGLPNKMIVILGCIASGILWILMTFVTSITAYQKKKSTYEMNIYQRDLTNIMAHDLKSPLMVIRGSAENLQDEEKNENEYAKTIIEESDYMSSLISRILSLSKLESNQTEMKREEVDIKSIFDEIIEKYSEETEKREIKTTIESSDRIRTIKADSFWIKEALMNLYDNAVKYSEDGSEIKINLGEKEITISNKMADSEIKEKDIEKLKKSFVRGDNARSGQAGNGLGLSIAESILMRNNLSLSLRKEKDNFIVSIK